MLRINQIQFIAGNDSLSVNIWNFLSVFAHPLEPKSSNKAQ